MSDDKDTTADTLAGALAKVVETVTTQNQHLLAALREQGRQDLESRATIYSRLIDMQEQAGANSARLGALLGPFAVCAPRNRAERDLVRVAMLQLLARLDAADADPAGVMPDADSAGAPNAIVTDSLRMAQAVVDRAKGVAAKPRKRA